MITLRSSHLPVLALACLAFLAGCAHPGHTDPARLGPFYSPTNYTGDASLGGIRRVVVLPTWVGEGTPVESAASLDAVFLTALQKANRFEVVSLSRAEVRRRHGVEAWSSAAALPEDFFRSLQRDFAADAVLFIDLTTFSAYKPLTVGLRGKLATIDRSRLIWTFDNVFAAADPATANGARHYFVNRDRSVPADLTAAVLQSPSKFSEYAATEMFKTLPPVVPSGAVITK